MSVDVRAKLAKMTMTPEEQMELQRICKVERWKSWLWKDKGMSAVAATTTVEELEANLY